MYDEPAFVYLFSGYPLRSSEGHAKKTFHHRDTEDTEKFKKQSGTLCVLCVSSERNERVAKRIINPDNRCWSEVDNQIVLKVCIYGQEFLAQTLAKE